MWGSGMVIGQSLLDENTDNDIRSFIGFIYQSASVCLTPYVSNYISNIVASKILGENNEEKTIMIAKSSNSWISWI